MHTPSPQASRNFIWPENIECSPQQKQEVAAAAATMRAAASSNSSSRNTKNEILAIEFKITLTLLPFPHPPYTIWEEDQHFSPFGFFLAAVCPWSAEAATGKLRAPPQALSGRRLSATRYVWRASANRSAGGGSAPSHSSALSNGSSWSDKASCPVQALYCPSNFLFVGR